MSKRPSQEELVRRSAEIANVSTVDELITALARPILNYRMASGMLSGKHYFARTSAQIRSARTRAGNAAAEIDAIVRNYINNSGGKR